MTKLATQIEGDLIALLDDYYSLPETWNDELDKQLAEWYSNPPKVWPKRPYFSPSSLGDCPRELYIKAKHGSKARDQLRSQPHQGRWRKLGTISGDMIQRDMLDIEDNYEKQTGNKPRFRFLRDKQGRPLFEDFAKTNKKVTHDGETFYLYGAPDGIMEYLTDDGELVRVGLEIKTKQTTPARTSQYSMKQPDSGHARQIVAYSEMFDCEYYVILYVNLAKQKWNMTEEEYEKTPDIRAFCAKINDDHKAEVFQKAADVTRAVRENKPPKLDIDGWAFNNFKQACAKDLSEEEIDELRALAERAKHSSLPEYRIYRYVRTVEEIEELREAD